MSRLAKFRWYYCVFCFFLCFVEFLCGGGGNSALFVDRDDIT